MASVVVILDRSLSMPMNGLFWAARERACEVIEALSGPDSPDHLHAVVTFGTRASLVSPSEVGQLEWEHDYGSNLEAALKATSDSLDGAPARLLLLSDLFAGAHTGDDGQVVFSCPPVQETLDRTIEALRDCGRAQLSIDALRYRSGESYDQEEERVVSLIGDVILTAGGTVEDTFTADDGVDRGDGPMRPWRYSG
jgi:uncharacterized protein with von Willebrand factor type A (vWA) domain